MVADLFALLKQLETFLLKPSRTPADEPWQVVKIKINQEIKVAMTLEDWKSSTLSVRSNGGIFMKCLETWLKLMKIRITD